jgi:hypothetical protein
MCGIDIPDGQSVCSMCYGDPFFGNDGYYLAQLMREIKHDGVMERYNEPLDDEYDEANNLPF